MQAENIRPLVNLPAGQLYHYQSTQVKAADKSPEAVKAVFSAYIELGKANQPKVNQVLDVVNIPARKEISAFAELISVLYDKECEEKKALCTFFDSIVKEHNESQDPNVRLASIRLLGQFLFLLDTDVKLVELIANKNPKTAIATSFTNALKMEAINLDAIVTERKKYKIVAESNDLRRNLLPDILAKLLITSTGMLNTAIFDDVKNVFFLKGDPANQKEIADMLAHFEKHEELYTLLGEVKAPIDALSQQDIRVMLELSDDSEVTDAHARECVLAACLSQVVPAAADDDVPTVFCQLLKQANPTRFMDLLHTLLRDELEVEVEGQSEPVEFALDGNSSSLHKTLSVGIDGSITNNAWYANDRLWQVHGIIKACNAMEIENVEEACVNALKILGGVNPSKRFDVTAKRVIFEIAKAEVSKLKEKEPELELTAEGLAITGNIAFTATYENVLACGLQNALQKMAAIRPQAEYLARVHHAVRDVLFDTFTSKDIHERAALSRIFTSFLANLNNALTLEPPAKAFQELVVKALPEADLVLPQVQAIATFINTDAFAQSVSAKYIDAVKKPWGASLSVDPTGFVRTFNGASTKFITPKDAKELFIELLQKPAGTLVSPQHALMFTPEHEALSKSHAAKFWGTIQDQANANLKILVNSPEGRRAIYTWVQENLIDPAVKNDFAEGLTNPSTTIMKNLEFAKFHEQLLIRISGFIQGDGLKLAQRELEDFFVTDLHKAKKIEVIAFASTMREIDGTATTMCFYQDPISNTFSLGMLRAGNLVRLDQNEWFSEAWELGQAEAEAVLV